MKMRYRLFAFFIALIISGTFSCNVLAMNTGFSTEEISNESKKHILSNIKLYPYNNEITDKPIECFDVNKDGFIALGFKNSRDRYICVYDSSFKFKYGYVFTSEGDFGIEWDNENLNIFFVRSDIIASFDKEGNNIDVKKAQNTIENNSYYNNHISAKQRIVGNTKYIIKNNWGIFNIFSTSYSLLVTVDENGNETILYDINTFQFVKTIIIFIIVLAFIAFAISKVVKLFIKNFNNGK